MKKKWMLEGEGATSRKGSRLLHSIVVARGLLRHSHVCSLANNFANAHGTPVRVPHDEIGWKSDVNDDDDVRRTNL